MSQEDCGALEDQQEQQFADLFKVVGWIRELCELDPLPLEFKKIMALRMERLCAGEHQSVSSSWLPIGDMAEDILNNPNDRIALL